MTINLLGWSTALTISTILSYKAVGTTLCYVFRCVLEGAIIEEFKTFVKFVLDFCYLGLALIIFNLAQNNPQSAINSFLLHISSQSATITEVRAQIIFLIFVMCAWVIAILNCKRISRITGRTNLELLKKSMYISVSGFISFCLFSLGLLFQ